MASYKIKFLTIILSVQTFLSITTAFQTGIRDTDAIANCEKMHDNCIPNKSSKIKPSALDCVKRAIGYWKINGFQKGDVYTYYETFHKQLQLDPNFLEPKKICEGLSFIRALLCNEQVKYFGDSKESALSWALLNTNFDDAFYDDKLRPGDVEVNFGRLYLQKIWENVSIKPDIDSCIREILKTCAPYLNQDITDIPRSRIPVYSIHCIKMAIEYWRLDTMPPGIVKEYYQTFSGNLNFAFSSISDYCDSHPEQLKHLCRDELKDFGNTKEEAIEFALYNRSLNDFKNMSRIINIGGINTVEVHFGVYYMGGILNSVKEKVDSQIKMPIKFCEDKFKIEKSVLNV